MADIEAAIKYLLDEVMQETAQSDSQESLDLSPAIKATIIRLLYELIQATVMAVYKGLPVWCAMRLIS